MTDDKRIFIYYTKDSPLTDLWLRFAKEYREKFYKTPAYIKGNGGMLRWMTWLTEELKHSNINLISNSRWIILEFETAEDKTMFLMRWS